MVISMGNIEKFFDDHPELENRREKILERARKVVEEGDIIAGGNIKEIFADLAPDFERELMSFEHIRIGTEALLGRNIAR